MPPRLLTLGKKAWELFQEKEVVDSRLVRTPVANSWQRCRDLKVDPVHSIRLAGSESLSLEERLDAKQQLIRIARPFMKDLYNFFRGSDFQVVLTDERGFLLEVVGEEHIQHQLEKVQLMPGAIWSEENKGTNPLYS